MCPYNGLLPGQLRESVSISLLGDKIEIITPIDCQTSNVIYELHCTKDSLAYIAQWSKTAFFDHFRFQ